MFKDSTVTSNLAYSCQFFIDDLFVKEKAFFDVNDSLNQYGQMSQLKYINDPDKPQGTVWASRRRNWIWEPDGIQISGVWVNNVLMRSGYSINYKDGYIQFNNAINTNSNVKLNYSFKYIETRNSLESNYLILDPRSFHVEDSQFMSGSGLSNLKDRIQLPFIHVENTGRSVTKPYEIGGLSKTYSTDIVIHIVSEDEMTNHKIRDLIQQNEEKYIDIFDVEKSRISGVFPLNRKGFLVNPSGTYEYLCNNYPYNNAKFKNNNLSNSFIKRIINEGCVSLNSLLYHGTMRLTIDTILSV